MKTDELVAMLARGNVEVSPRTVEWRLVLGLGFGTLVSVLLMVSTLELRVDLFAALGAPMFWFKLGFAASLMLGSLIAALRLGRPGKPVGHLSAGLVIPIAALWLLALATVTTAAPGQRLSMVFGATWTVCPWLIAMLAVPVFIGSMWSLAGLAPTRLHTAGACAGLLSGATAALVYSLHCPEMQAPFLAVWYVLGIALPTASGALLGPRLLRW